MKNIWNFFKGTLTLTARGSTAYYCWVGALLLFMAVGAIAYVVQLKEGLIVTNMRDQVSWGFYISNFTFLVGVAAAAVLLVIPAYVYNWKPIKEIAILGELLAVSAIIMCLLFVTVDIGRPDRFWHLIPFVGLLNFPQSLLAWDVVVLNVYLILNLTIAVYYLYNLYYKREPNKKFTTPLLLFSIPAAISIHTVTAFLYNGLGARPFWNASILAPRFLASAFCSGPAFMILVFLLVRKYTRFQIKDEAVQKIAELIAYAMFINLFLLGAEIFKEYYTGSVHLAPMKYLLQGLHGHSALVPWIWTAMIFNFVAFLIFLIPETRRNNTTLIIGCVLIFVGVYIEKGMGLVLPGFIPDVLHEIYEYVPTGIEMLLALGIWATGLFVFTMLLRVAIPILNGDFHVADDGVGSYIGDQMFFIKKGSKEAPQEKQSLSMVSAED
ncbi:MAG: polysulfide reductase NrfD [Deltaproteobacteria bacterium]|jgi:molybdopterin-containing oxidoreductase family membrane subunit|nr:polysulfide reductase NrfD [Deltaproteobacteria bacterium]MBW2505283.1 polysulfide reductase NrfD [Deltaproteobacteria bacterium]MBW2519445.1 polysulfide reductase NrfD [Deltaproteobacteria bacterium]